jgi:hypothetical protein
VVLIYSVSRLLETNFWVGLINCNLMQID